MLIAALSFLLAAGLLGVVPNATAQADVPEPDPGWSLVWSDDFTGPAGSLPSSNNWIFDLGHSYPGGPANWGTGEIQSYTNSTDNISQDGNGNLRITPRRDAAGNWTSARIETQRSDFKPADGGVLRIEGRIQMPNVGGDAALGYWPAFWALGSPYRGNFWNWPEIGEFDIMENVNGLNSVWAVLHCGVAPGGPCNEFDGIAANRACPGSTCQSGFHTYRFEWDRSVSPNQLRWFVDGQQYHSVSQSQLPADTWNAMTSHEGYFILLNVAMGGSFPNNVAGFGTPTAATQPGHPMVVDYVAVYATGDGDVDPPPPPPPPDGEVDAYGRIEAESFDAQSGIQTEASSEGGENIGWIANGDWARYDGVDFGSGPPAHTFEARVASGAAGGVSGLVQVRLDSPTASPVAEFAVANTGGWQSWRTVPGGASGITGVHDVYLTFTSGQPSDFVNVNWFTFRR